MTVTQDDVRAALAELGRLRFGQMRVEDAMREIVQTTHTIFDVDGAGLMLADADHHLRNVAVSDERLGHLEELQIKHQEGPCVAAFEEKELIGAEDLASDQRRPLFSEAAVDRGVHAVLASPLPYNQDAVGVVAVLSEKRGCHCVPPGQRAGAGPTWRQSADSSQTLVGSASQEILMIVLGIVLLVIGFLLKIAILWPIGIIVLIVGLILLLLGSIGHAVGGRHYW